MAFALQSFETEDEEKKSLFSRILHYIVYALILALYLLFMWRMCSRGDTKLAKSYAWTQAARDVYAADASAFVVQTQEPRQSQVEQTTKKGNRFSFALSSIAYTPSVGGLQFTIRYNDSLTEGLRAEYGDLPDGEQFVFAVIDNTGRIYTTYEWLADERNVNNYRRLVFEGLSTDAVVTEQEVDGVVTPVTTEITEFFVRIYYIGDVDYQKPLAALSVWQRDAETTAFDYDAPSRAALSPVPAYTPRKEN